MSVRKISYPSTIVLILPELEEMKVKLEQLGAEKETLVVEQIALKAEVDGADKKREEAVEEVQKTTNERLEKFRTQAKDQNRRQNAKIKDIEAAVATANAEKAEVEQNLQQTKAELQTVQDALQQAQMQPNNNAEGGEVNEDTQGDDHAQLHERVAHAEADASQHAAQAETLNNEVTRLQTRVFELEFQVSNLQQQLEDAQQTEQGELPQASSVSSEAFMTLQNELAAAQQQVETLRTDTARISSSNVPVPADDGEIADAQSGSQTAADLRTALEAQHAAATRAITDKAEERVKNMQTQLREKLKSQLEKDSKAREDLVARAFS